MKTWISIVAVISFITLHIQAQDLQLTQDLLLTDEYVSGAFVTTQLVNSQTTEMIAPKSFGFQIQHRFGAVSPDESVYKQFFGLDLPSNIRFAFAVPISKKIYAEIGRTKYRKTVDLGVKLNIDKQTKDNKVPVSIALYFNTATRTDDFPATDENTFFADSITPFEYVFAHRLAYNTQIIISRKFSNTLSLQIAPTFIYNNLVEAGKDNHTAAIPFSGRVKIGISSSILFEYAPMLNNRAEKDHRDPMHIAYELGTAGHVFQIVISSSSNMLEQDIYTSPVVDYLNGELLLGFNLKRNFWSKK